MEGVSRGAKFPSNSEVKRHLVVSFDLDARGTPVPVKE